MAFVAGRLPIVPTPPSTTTWRRCCAIVVVVGEEPTGKSKPYAVGGFCKCLHGASIIYLNTTNDGVHVWPTEEERFLMTIGT